MVKGEGFRNIGEEIVKTSSRMFPEEQVWRISHQQHRWRNCASKCHP